MAFVSRWLVSVAAALVFFPIAFVLWNGPDADFGLAGGMVLMLFLQFISPYNLWLIPLGFGTVIAIVWSFSVTRRVSRQAD